MDAVKNAVAAYVALVAGLVAWDEYYECFPSEDVSHELPHFYAGAKDVEAKVSAIFNAYENAFYAAENAADKALSHDTRNCLQIEENFKALRHPEAVRAENRWLA